MDPIVDLNSGRRPPVAPFIPPKPALLQPGPTSSTPGTVNFAKFPYQEGNIPQLTRQVTLKGIPPTDTSNLSASATAPDKLQVPPTAQPRKFVPVSQKGTLPIVRQDFETSANPIELYPSKPDALFVDG